MAPGVWLPKHFAMRGSAKILSLIPHHAHEDETYFGYHLRKPDEQLAGRQWRIWLSVQKGS